MAQGVPSATALNVFLTTSLDDAELSAIHAEAQNNYFSQGPQHQGNLRGKQPKKPAARGMLALLTQEAHNPKSTFTQHRKIQSPSPYHIYQFTNEELSGLEPGPSRPTQQLALQGPAEPVESGTFSPGCLEYAIVESPATPGGNAAADGLAVVSSIVNNPIALPLTKHLSDAQPPPLIDNRLMSFSRASSPDPTTVVVPQHNGNERPELDSGGPMTVDDYSLDLHSDQHQEHLTVEPSATYQRFSPPRSNDLPLDEEMFSNDRQSDDESSHLSRDDDHSSHSSQHVVNSGAADALIERDLASSPTTTVPRDRHPASSGFQEGTHAGDPMSIDSPLTDASKECSPEPSSAATVPSRRSFRDAKQAPIFTSKARLTGPPPPKKRKLVAKDETLSKSSSPELQRRRPATQSVMKSSLKRFEFLVRRL